MFDWVLGLCWRGAHFVLGYAFHPSESIGVFSSGRGGVPPFHLLKGFVLLVLCVPP